MSKKKKLELTQAVHDPVTGEVLHHPGKVIDPKDDLVAMAGVSAFREIDVEEAEHKPEPKPEPKHTTQPKHTEKDAE